MISKRSFLRRTDWKTSYSKMEQDVSVLVLFIFNFSTLFLFFEIPKFTRLTLKRACLLTSIKFSCSLTFVQRSRWYWPSCSISARSKFNWNFVYSYIKLYLSKLHCHYSIFKMEIQFWDFFKFVLFAVLTLKETT